LFWTAFGVCLTPLLNDVDEEGGSGWMRQQAPSGAPALQKYQRASVCLLDWNHVFLLTADASVGDLTSMTLGSLADASSPHMLPELILARGGM
jgi:hypothetical protein